MLYFVVNFWNSQVREFPASLESKDITGVFTRKTPAIREAKSIVDDNEADYGLVYFLPKHCLNTSFEEGVLKACQLVYSTDEEMFPVVSKNNVVTKASNSD